MRPGRGHADLVWESCWPEEKALFSDAVADTDDDSAAMAFLETVEARNREETAGRSVRRRRRRAAAGADFPGEFPSGWNHER